MDATTSHPGARPPLCDTARVVNLATGETMGEVPQSPAADVDASGSAGTGSYPEWRSKPPGDGIRVHGVLTALTYRGRWLS